MSGPLEKTHSRYLMMFALILSGEMVFSLPFHVPRYFRPSILEAFHFSNADLGDVFAVYGVMAMLAYFPGGAIAQRFSGRKLMTLSLAATALGGFFMATLPGTFGMSMLYGYWGVTTILLFWAAMVRATRQWGGPLAQGRAFGILDGGRGLTSALFATIAVWCFSVFVSADLQQVSDQERREAIRSVIIFYSCATLGTSALVWFLVPDPPDDVRNSRPPGLSDMRAVIARPIIWLQALVVVCAYCGYKGLDNYSLYAFDVLSMSETDSANFAAKCAYIRPFAAISAGILADRFGVARNIGVIFGILVAAYALLGTMSPTVRLAGIIYANIFITFFCVFSLRGIYFALLGASQLPHHLTGAAVGLISLVGYTPDIFFAPVAGRLLDATPGVGGHQHYFILLAGTAIIGTTTAVFLARRLSRAEPR